MASSDQDDADPRNLINSDGSVFDADLPTLAEALEVLTSDERVAYRNRNAAEIASHEAARMLVVAGPGAGKSHLFLARINHWLPTHDDARIYVASFVRKLVRDLRADVESKLDPDSRRRVTVTTLHSLARSLVERNHGTRRVRLTAHVKMITPEWQDTVWEDVLLFHNELRGDAYGYRRFAEQMHLGVLEDTAEWSAIHATVGTLSTFYNAVGFLDLIVLAREALEENPELTSTHYGSLTSIRTSTLRRTASSPWSVRPRRACCSLAMTNKPCTKG